MAKAPQRHKVTQSESLKGPFGLLCLIAIMMIVSYTVGSIVG